MWLFKPNSRKTVISVVIHVQTYIKYEVSLIKMMEKITHNVRVELLNAMDAFAILAKELINKLLLETNEPELEKRMWKIS